ncbi:hypothetical protein K0M31_007742 [Melipona bicolor]|uniref:Uncharacterized protein n=1 Tax=Melipona bicolor TaxID=60889 RepID=A0AA40GBY9_9HYME|nr:hypothetical protein K0M31_007742 [Melipona bicolor]
MICNEDGAKKSTGSFIHWKHEQFDFASVARNATPTPRSPLTDASLIKILVLYCSTLINVRNNYASSPDTSFFTPHTSLLPHAVTYPISVSKKWSLTTGEAR